MPRKIKSSAEPTQNRDTSVRRAAGAQKKKSSKRQATLTPVADGGKWAGSGKKTSEKKEGPEIRHQGNTGRGARRKTVRRSAGGAA